MRLPVNNQLPFAFSLIQNLSSPNPFHYLPCGVLSQNERNLEISRIVLVVESRDIYDQSTKEALLMTTNVISSFLLFLVPLTLTIIAAILNSRRQPEHFMKVLLSSKFPFFVFVFNFFV